MDFISGAQLEARADGGLWQLILTQSVYEGLIRQDIGDIRIFDGSGLQVPMKIVDGRTGFHQEPKTQALNFFPLMTRGDGYIDMSTTRFRMDETGAIMGVDSQAKDGAGNILTSYIIDASRLDGEPESLRVKWSDQPGKFVTTVDVKASRDLNFWFGLSSNSTLAQIPCGQLMFFQDIIGIPKAMAGYWLITWPGGKKGVTLESVEVIYPSEQNAVTTIWSQATPRGAGVGGEYQFEIPAGFPASQVKIHVMWPDFCSRAKVYSRSSQTTNWEFHADTTLFNLTAGDNNIQNGVLDVRPANHRFWKVQIDPESTSGAGPLPPTFQVGWTPHSIYFVASGQEPFVLAFGSGRENLNAPPPDPVLEPIGWGKPGVVAAPARLGGAYILGGNNALYPNRPLPPDPRKKRLILIAGGVIALCLLAVLILLAGLLLSKRKAAAKASQKALEEDDWTEAQAAAETEDLDDTGEHEAVAAEAREMADSWGLPDQEDVDSIVSDSESMIGGTSPEPASMNDKKPQPKEQPALLQEDLEDLDFPISSEEESKPAQGVAVHLGEDGSLDQSQLDMLLTQSGFTGEPLRSKKEFKPKKSSLESSVDPNEGALNQDDLDALLSTQAGVKPSTAPKAGLDESNALNQDDLDALLTTQVNMSAPDPVPVPQVNDDGTLDQAALDALLANQSFKEPHLPREPKKKPDAQYKANEDGTLNQAALNAMLHNAGYNITVPTAEPVQTEGLSFEGALDQSQLDQIVGESDGPVLEKETEQEPPPVIKQFSQEELDDLFDGAGRLDDWAPPPKEPEPELVPVLPVPEALQTEGQLSQADLDAFFDTPAAAPPAPKMEDNAAMNQDDLDALFDAPPKPEVKAQPVDNAAMNQDDLDALFDAPPKPETSQAPAPPAKARPTARDKGVAPVFQAAGKKKKSP
ncbi:MAG: DUF3999 domain-containing protein [Desulfatibacillum sp.]|nr:DUF3999 domain-containing protein [Desulfatibacillum sp.]